MECVNCGKHGHTFRDCLEPVQSFGICAIKFMSDMPYYLLIRRRDSLAYVEFLRGKYRMDNNTYIQVLFNGMTIDERRRLIELPFDKLWENLWFSQVTRQFRNEYESAKRTFGQLKNTGDMYGKLLNKYIEDVTTNWVDPEWGFPKGRRTLHETELSCALREFSEETCFSKQAIRVLTDMPTMKEEYVGTNGIQYRQVYYLAICDAGVSATHNPMNKVMNREVGNIGWYSYEDAFNLIRATNTAKREMLTRLHTYIQSATIRDTMTRALVPFS